MRIIDCQQGTDEWKAARLGRVTASGMHRLITASGKPSAQADRYIARLAAEWFMGVSLDEASSGFMERGNELEPEARAYYAVTKDAEVRQVGFCLRDDINVGASPDGLVGDDGLVEIKCPSAEVHMTYVLGGLTDEYHTQVQGQLWVTDRKWVDLCCFHPILPPVIKRVDRDQRFIDALAGIAADAVRRLDDVKVRLAADKRAHDRRRAEAIEAASEHPFDYAAT